MNSSKLFIDKLQRKIEEAFKAQNSEIFDVAFEIDGKKLYADKLRLSVISPTFKSLLSGSKISKPIKIKEYKFEDFKEFLTFIYSGECIITDENVYDLLNMAEFYQINYLKKACDEYLAKMKIDWSNIFQLMETANKYFLIQIRKPVVHFISANFTTFVNQNVFLNTSKLFIEEIVALESTETEPEEIFKAVFEWANHQAAKKENEPSDVVFVMNDAIKEEMTQLLPYMQFKKMKLSFVVNYVVKHAIFLFTGPELSEILSSLIPKVKIQASNSTGQLLHGFLPYYSDAIDIIKSLKKDRPLIGDRLMSWKTNGKNIPSNPNRLKKTGRALWYLVYFTSGDALFIGLKWYSVLNENDVLLAELFPPGGAGFDISSSYKIEIV